MYIKDLGVSPERCPIFGNDELERPKSSKTGRQGMARARSPGRRALQLRKMRASPRTSGACESAPNWRAERDARIATRISRRAHLNCQEVACEIGCDVARRAQMAIICELSGARSARSARAQCNGCSSGRCEKNACELPPATVLVVARKLSTWINRVCPSVRERLSGSARFSSLAVPRFPQTRS